jgi:hemerythrin-like domain-containing protein
LCLRIHRGIAENKEKPSWVNEESIKAVQFYDAELVLHFKAEEEILFPPMQDFQTAQALIEELLIEHRSLAALVEQLRARANESLEATLKEFADALESHIRKEERALFPIYESEISKELADRIEEGIVRLIGDARYPRNPKLLE